MRFGAALLLVAPFLSSSVDAFSGLEERQAQCGRDACGRFVARPPIANRRAECSSFLRKTVTPCAVTSTRTTTVTMLGQSVVRTATATVTAARTTTVTQDRSVATTVTQTSNGPQPAPVVQTVTQSTTVQSRNTVTVTATTGTVATRTEHVTETETVTVTANPNARRDAQPENKLGGLQELDARQNAQCPSTRSPTSVPAGAGGACRPAAYSSACSCIGVRSARTTLRASTVSRTSTVFVTSRPTNTITVTQTATPVQTVTTARTVTVPTTTVTTKNPAQQTQTTTAVRTVTQVNQVTMMAVVTTTNFATTTETETETVTETITPASSAGPSPPAAPTSCFYARVDAGSYYYPNYYFGLAENGAMKFQASVGDADVMYIDASSGDRLRTPAGEFVNVENYNDPSVMFESAYDEIRQADRYILTCSTGSAGQLVCSVPAGLSYFTICEADYPSFGSSDGAERRGCAVLDIRTESVACPTST